MTVLSYYTYDGKLVLQTKYHNIRPENFTGFCVVTNAVCGSISWWADGKIHNFTGPALVFDDGAEYWYAYGRCISKEDCEFLYKLCQLKGIEKIS